MDNIEAEVRRFATDNHMVIWEDMPWDGTMTTCPDSFDLQEFLVLARTVGTRIIYIDADGNNAAFAYNGVIHVYNPGDDGSFDLSDIADDVSVDYDDDQSDGSFALNSKLQEINDPYYDYRLGKIVDGEVRQAIDSLLADDRYDGYRTRQIETEYVTNLAQDEADVVERIARNVFNATVGGELDRRASAILADLVNDPEYDPLGWEAEYRVFIEERVEGLDPRIQRRLERLLSNYSYESGARAQAERELTKSAEALLQSLTPLERDRLGFSSRISAKQHVLAPYLGELSQIQSERIVKEAGRLERDSFAAQREHRYATAARRLEAANVKRVEITRRLGVSGSVIDRLMMTYRSDIELANDDPIITDLAPEFF